jgi:hypothetical protein
MALQKEITTKYGVNADYWKVDHVEVQYDQKRATAFIKPYRNKAARDAGSSPLDETQEFVLDFDAITATENLRENIYTFIKTQDFFSDAVDV